MKKVGVRRKLVWLGAWMMCVASAQGEDLTISNGKVLRDVEIKDADCDSITVSHRGGTSRIPLADLPVEVRERFSPSELLRQLRLKTAELEKAKGELATVRGVAAKLASAAQLSARDVSSPPEATSATAVKPVLPISSLPDLKASDVVAADEIAQHYKTDPRSADLRYRKKVFRIQGKIERFDEKLFVRKTAVVLESPERFQRVVCEWPFPDEFNAVYSTKGGQVLVGVSGNRREVRLMGIGESVTFEGKCAGSQSGGIVFTQCEIVRKP